MTLYMGIDPGGNGAAAWIEHGEEGIKVGWMLRKEMTLADMASLFDNLPEPLNTFCWIEKQSPQSLGRIACFKLGVDFGEWRGCGLTAGVGMFEVPAKRWQQICGIGTGKKLTYRERKRRNKGFAQQLYPEIKDKINDANADALLIAYACMCAMKSAGVRDPVSPK